MPNYPKYNSARRVELANQMKAFIAQDRLFGENTETGNRIKAAAPGGDWLQMAIRFFTPTDAEYNTNSELWNKKLYIREKLFGLESCINGLDDMSDPDNVPGQAEERWNNMMQSMEAAADLYDEILSYNEATGNKHITDPGLQAALGAARGIMSIVGMLQQVERTNKFNAAREFADTYDGRKSTVTGLLDVHRAECEANHVIAYSLMDPRIDADNLANQFDGIQKKYQALIEEYDRVTESEEKEATETLWQNLNPKLRKENAGLLLLDYKIAMIERAKKGIEVDEARRVSDGLEQEFKNALQGMDPNVSYDVLDVLHEKYVKMLPVIDALNNEKLSGEELVDLYTECSSGVIYWKRKEYSYISGKVYTILREELEAENIETIKATISEHFTKYFKEPHDKYPIKQKLAYDEALKKLDTLVAEERSLWNNENNLYWKVKNNSYIKKNFSEEQKDSALNFNLENLDAELLAAKQQRAQKAKHIAELQETQPSYTDIHKARKEVSKTLENVNQILETKKNEVRNNIRNPIKQLEEKDKVLKNQVKALNDETAQMKRDISELTGFDPVADSRAKMRGFADMLGKNKRLLHSDGDEFKALRQLVENYANNAGDVTMEQIQAASKTYLDAKEKQVFSANSKMRNYRKAVVSMIGEYAGVTAKKVKDFNERMTEFNENTEIINAIPEEDVDYLSYCTVNQDFTKLQRDFKAGLDAHTNDIKIPLQNAEMEIERLNTMVKAEQERKLAQSEKVKDEELSNVQGNKKPKSDPVFGIR